MRITQGMMNRRYLGFMNNNLSNLTSSNEKMASQRSFSKSWENSSAANRALRVRALMRDNERALANIEEVQGRYQSAEDNMRAINNILDNVQSKTMLAANGTVPESERELIAKEISNLQNQILQVSNTKYGTKYVYGASSNKTGAAPFSVDANGKLLFNGNTVPVDDMIADANHKPTTDGTTPILYNTTSYIDIGTGFKYDAAAGAIDPNTALPSTFSGVEIFGFGKSDDGWPNNLYSLLGELSDTILSGDPEKIMQGVEHLQDRQSGLLMQITDLGNNTALLESTSERLTNDNLNLATVQQSIEGIDYSEEIMYNKTHEMAWMVTLQLGSKVLPATLFDFMR